MLQWFVFPSTNLQLLMRIIINLHSYSQLSFLFLIWLIKQDMKMKFQSTSVPSHYNNFLSHDYSTVNKFYLVNVQVCARAWCDFSSVFPFVSRKSCSIYPPEIILKPTYLAEMWKNTSYIVLVYMLIIYKFSFLLLNSQ